MPTAVPKVWAVSPSALLIVSVAKPTLVRSMLLSRYSRIMNQISRAPDLRTVARSIAEGWWTVTTTLTAGSP